MIQMVPSINLRGGGDHQSGVATAFVSPSLLLQRQSTSISTSASSIGSSIPLEDDSFLRGGDQSSSSYHQQDKKKLQRVARQDEPNLYNIPSNLHPTYQPIPIIVQLLIAIISASIVGRVGLSTFLKSISLHKWLFKQLLKSMEVVMSIELPKAISFLLRTALLSNIAKLSIQEVFYMPSRVTTQYLIENDELPSRLSRYTQVQPVPVSSPTKEVLATSTSWNDDDDTTKRSTPSSIGVHSIQYKQQHQLTDDTSSSKYKKYDGIYLHHGFGASSLSWLPVLPSLVQKIGSSKCIGVAHDAPGFGFTDRPNANVDGGLYQYGFENNVGIGLALLKDVLAEQESQDGSVSRESVVALFGHSMGSKSTLLQALYYAKHPEMNVKPNLVVLVAPALEGATLPSRKAIVSSSSTRKSRGKNMKTSFLRKLTTRAWLAWRKIFVDYPFQYGLRRLVGGSKDFWRKGLALAWGNVNKLSDSDVLRFQWPSIGQGWEEGLINFTRARILSSPIPSQHMLDDEELLAEVANLKDTRVIIVYGSNDKVVRIEGNVAEKLKIDYPNIKLIRMEGSGHDPYEEDVDEFMMELENAIG